MRLGRTKFALCTWLLSVASVSSAHIDCRAARIMLLQAARSIDCAGSDLKGLTDGVASDPTLTPMERIVLKDDIQTICDNPELPPRALEAIAAHTCDETPARDAP